MVESFLRFTQNQSLYFVALGAQFKKLEVHLSVLLDSEEFRNYSNEKLLNEKLRTRHGQMFDFKSDSSGKILASSSGSSASAVSGNA